MTRGKIPFEAREVWVAPKEVTLSRVEHGTTWNKLEHGVEKANSEVGAEPGGGGGTTKIGKMESEHESLFTRSPALSLVLSQQNAIANQIMSLEQEGRKGEGGKKRVKKL